ncbi:hypothetical protein Vi05172_g4818 [Venturia inaequalis]|nr:hypothetical protein Vi05172_g4818 [Venturia inaequalis]
MCWIINDDISGTGSSRSPAQIPSKHAQTSSFNHNSCIPVSHQAAGKAIYVLLLPRKIGQAILHHSYNIEIDLRPHFGMVDLEYHLEHLTRRANTLKEIHPLLSRNADEAEVEWMLEFQEYLIKLQKQVLRKKLVRGKHHVSSFSFASSLSVDYLAITTLEEAKDCSGGLSSLGADMARGNDVASVHGCIILTQFV